MAHILIADDEIGLAHLTAAHCRIWGHSSAIAADGEEALELIGRECFDLVLLDALMPYMDGPVVARWLRACAVNRHLPIIGLAARGCGQAAMLREAGVTVVVEKPFQIEELRLAIERVLGIERRAS